MRDPIGAFDNIRDNFILYLKTAFGTRYPSLEKEREELFLKPGVFYQEPWIEPIPKYKTSGKTIRNLTNRELPGFSDQDIEDFKSLVSCGLFKDYPLHHHQMVMLKKHSREKLHNNCRYWFRQNRGIPSPPFCLPRLRIFKMGASSQA